MLIPIKLTKMTTLAQDARQARERLTSIGSLRRRQLLCEAFKSYAKLKKEEALLLAGCLSKPNEKAVVAKIAETMISAAAELATCNGLLLSEFQEAFRDWEDSQ
jgi:hypothetical protein